MSSPSFYLEKPTVYHMHLTFRKSLMHAAGATILNVDGDGILMTQSVITVMLVMTYCIS